LDKIKGDLKIVDWFVPAGAIAFFELSTCPKGWKWAVNVKGRYIVASSSVGGIEKTVGVALGNEENRAVGKHAHAIEYEGKT
jgi:hypothetical protein